MSHPVGCVLAPAPDRLQSHLVISHPEPVRVFRIALIALGVVFLALAFFKLNVRQIDRTGLCGSIVQGSTHDDGGSTTADCNRMRHGDGVAAVEWAERLPGELREGSTLLRFHVVGDIRQVELTTSEGRLAAAAA